MVSYNLSIMTNMSISAKLSKSGFGGHMEHDIHRDKLDYDGDSQSKSIIEHHFNNHEFWGRWCHFSNDLPENIQKKARTEGWKIQMSDSAARVIQIGA